MVTFSFIDNHKLFQFIWKVIALTVNTGDNASLLGAFVLLVLSFGFVAIPLSYLFTKWIQSSVLCFATICTFGFTTCVSGKNNPPCTEITSPDKIGSLPPLQNTLVKWTITPGVIVSLYIDDDQVNSLLNLLPHAALSIGRLHAHHANTTHTPYKR